MELAFATKSLRNICENEVCAKQEYGTAVAELLKHRLADLCAARTVNELVAGSPKILPNSSRHEHMTIDLYDGYKIIISANHRKQPISLSDRVDWSKVTRIKVLEIVRIYV